MLKMLYTKKKLNKSYNFSQYGAFRNHDVRLQTKYELPVQNILLNQFFLITNPSQEDYHQ